MHQNHCQPLAEATIADIDVAIIGGGPAGLSAATWAARYRRRVVVFDSGEQRNLRVESTHGYLGMDGASPHDLLARARIDLERYTNVELRQQRIVAINQLRDGFALRLEDGTRARALRLVLATGVRDLLPQIRYFDDYYGSSIFTCSSCDGYESQGKAVVVLGAGDELDAFSLGLLDWAASITVLYESEPPTRKRLEGQGIRVLVGTPAEVYGSQNKLQGLRLRSGEPIECSMMFCVVRHEQRSSLARDLGCDISPEGCVIVNEHNATTVAHVYAIGDITPGPHLVQVAAAKGAVAGIAAAMSLRGHHGVSTSSEPAPDSASVLNQMH